MKKIVFIAFMLLMAVAMQGQVTFTAAEWANAQSLSNGAAVTGYSQDGVTVEFAQGTGSNAVVWNTSQNAIVTRQGNTMTVSVADGQVITSASFTMKQNSHANALAGSTWSDCSAEANNTVATWTGSAQTITVTIGGTALFDSFSITAEVPEVPFVEDESTYNDTTIITPQEIADENFMGADDEFDNLSYSKEGKQLTLSEVKQIMKETAIRDEWVTTGPNATHFGNGKIDALAGIQYILNEYGGHDYQTGDVNHDDDVNIADVTKLIDYLLGIQTDVCLDCADVNGDEDINIADVTFLIDLLLGMN